MTIDYLGKDPELRNQIKKMRLITNQLIQGQKELNYLCEIMYEQLTGMYGKMGLISEIESGLVKFKENGDE